MDADTTSGTSRSAAASTSDDSDDSPTVHLWNPIVGVELLATINGGSEVSVHVPASLVSGIAAECGVGDAAMLLELLVRAALPHLDTACDCPDLFDDLALVVEPLGWHGAQRLEVTMHANLDPAVSVIRITTGTELVPIELPTFPTIRNVPGWSSKREDLWEPHRFVDDIPMVVSARAGGRPGWGVTRGVDLRGVLRGLDRFKTESFSGWPHIVLESSTDVVRLAVEWDIRGRDSGELLMLHLRPLDDADMREHEAPEFTVAIDYAPEIIVPFERADRILRRESSDPLPVAQAAQPMSVDAELDELVEMSEDE